ncbi:MAG: hypothetical protein QOK10_2494 [Pseudonocardiales bacterium]|jgi:predicted nucleic acid-binding protein|nr:hypothetical protein [Pseudonocardiales bacterium]
MILADTSIWVDHLRSSNQLFADLLDGGRVLTHPWVIGELVLGGLNDLALKLLRGMPRATVATEDEVLHLITRERLSGKGIGYVDAQLLAASRLTLGSKLWTKDTRLLRAAEAVGTRFLPA